MVSTARQTMRGQVTATFLAEISSVKIYVSIVCTQAWKNKAKKHFGGITFNTFTQNASTSSQGNARGWVIPKSELGTKKLWNASPNHLIQLQQSNSWMKTKFWKRMLNSGQTTAHFTGHQLQLIDWPSEVTWLLRTSLKLFAHLLLTSQTSALNFTKKRALHLLALKHYKWILWQPSYLSSS